MSFKNDLIIKSFSEGGAIIYYYIVSKTLLDNLEVAYRKAKKWSIKRVIKRFDRLNNKFRNYYQNVIDSYHKSLFQERYFENKKLINKLIRLMKNKKFYPGAVAS